jgi:hypothetical protein
MDCFVALQDVIYKFREIVARFICSCTLEPPEYAISILSFNCATQLDSTLTYCLEIKGMLNQVF